MNMASKVQKNVEKSREKRSLSPEIDMEESSDKMKLIDVILMNLQRKKIKFKRKRRFLESKENLGKSWQRGNLNENPHFLNGTSNLKNLINVRNMLEIQKKCRTSSAVRKSKKKFY